MEQVPWAHDLAKRRLAEVLPRRWAHVQGVAAKAEHIAHLVGEDAQLLICAAWLHDLGYSPDIANTGFHPLDGARYLRDVERADERLCRLVARHSGAAVEARHRGLAADLDREFPPTGGFLLDALDYCDMTTSPHGEPTTVQARLAEILTRYDPDHVVARSITEASPQLIRAVRTVAAAL